MAHQLQDPVEHGGDDEVAGHQHVHPSLGDRPRSRARWPGQQEERDVVSGRVAPDDGAELDPVHVLGPVAAHDEVRAVALERREGEGGARRRRDVVGGRGEGRLEGLELGRVSVHDEDLGGDPGVAHGRVSAGSAAAPPAVIATMRRTKASSSTGLVT